MMCLEYKDVYDCDDYIKYIGDSTRHPHPCKKCMYNLMRE